MRTALSWTLVLLVANAGYTAAPTETIKPEADPNAVEARYADGSIVKMTLLQSSLQVTTRFGKLTVPLTEIRRIDLALRLPENVARRIDDAASKLGSSDFRERETASAELLKHRELAYPAVVKATRSTDLETSRRAKDVLAGLREKVPADKLRIKDHDVIQTTEFTIIGLIADSELRAKSPYFGEIQVQLTDLRSLRLLKNSSENEVVVDAARYAAVQETWMETEIEVLADTRLELTATGQADLWPVGVEAGRYVTGPAGNKNFNLGVPTFPPGALLGRIGTNGKPFLIGDAYAGAPTEEGKLYLRIVGSPWGNASSGSYTVKIGLGNR